MDRTFVEFIAQNTRKFVVAFPWQKSASIEPDCASITHSKAHTEEQRGQKPAVRARSLIAKGFGS
jgi:hypothetical protein